MTHQLLESRCAGTDPGAVRPLQMLHVLFDGPSGHAGWLLRLAPRTVLDRLHPARMRSRLAAIGTAEFAAALDSLAAGETGELRRLGYSVTRTE